MKKILIINTGGTFNKIYNPLTGNLDIDSTGNAIKSIAKAWLTKFNLLNIIGKDSLDITDKDRALLIQNIQAIKEEKIIIVHGTDTMHITAKHLNKYNLNKTIVLTGAMVPYAINPIEAISNLCSAYGFVTAKKEFGVFIAMNGIIKDYERVVKNKEKGYFEKSK